MTRKTTWSFLWPET